ncbi:MAG: hypothetical protein LBG31_04810 [Prevotellaceae bacterium]|jgi:hypothetical protein|nr:hypothetical protein [Prevotellaceae bacterium]
MKTITINILHPNAIALLENLAGLNLISIEKKEPDKNDAFMDAVRQIRSKAQNPPSMEEITAEVEKVRAGMYAVKV